MSTFMTGILMESYENRGDGESYWKEIQGPAINYLILSRVKTLTSFLIVDGVPQSCEADMIFLKKFVDSFLTIT